MPLRLRLGWKWWSLIVATAFAASALGAVVWYHSNADLAAVAAEARARGLPITWQELEPAVSPTPRVALWQRIVRAQASLPSWVDGASRDQRPLPFPGEPLPPGLREHYATLNEESIGALEAMIDELGATELRLESEPVSDASSNHWWIASKLVDLLDERLILAPAADAHACALRAIRLVRSIGALTYQHYYHRWSASKLLCQSIVFRQTELMGDDQVITELTRLAADLEDQDARLFEFNLTGLYSEVSDLTRWGGPTQRPLLNVSVRMFRAKTLRAWLDCTEQVRRHRGDLRGIIAALHSIPGSRKSRWEWVHYYSLGRARPDLVFNTHCIDENWMAAIQCRLVASLLSNTPFPRDPFDPAGGYLREIVRDGIVIGAYSVGPDGLDSHGNRNEDRCWPLRARLWPARKP